MSVEIDERGTVTANGRPVDYATAYAWCVDSPETITELVHDTKAFATVIAHGVEAGTLSLAARERGDGFALPSANAPRSRSPPCP